ncbi:MAG: hypothetical protein HQ539_01115, partial [Parcubacteria group bacterium]|nr:hypothetical protein [Parcubacteria group bacterium]
MNNNQNNQKTSLLELNSNRQETIKIILDDLYKIDASLRQHEAELVEIIKQLIEAKPSAQLDESFRAELREQILKMAQEIKLNTKFGKSKFVWADIFMTPFLKPAGLVVAGIALALIVTVPIMLKQDRGEVEGINDFFALEVTETKDKAFGKLSLDAGSELVQVPTASPQAVADGRGGGGVMMSAEVEESSGMIEPTYMKMINYEYKYVYVGDEFTIDEQEMPVFQRIKDSGAAAGLASFLGGLSFQGLDLSKFKNAKVQNFSVVEDRDNGYMVSVDFVNGMVSMYKNWARWDIQTERRESLKMSDLPNDKSVIAIADKFLGHYGIDFTGYGVPEVQKDWLDYSEQEVGGKVWVPDTLTVIYPFLMNGEPVYDMGGRKTGVTVSVDIINMQAVAIYNLTGRQYESSSYEIETDTDKILEVAKTRNGYYGSG